MKSIASERTLVALCLTVATILVLSPNRCDARHTKRLHKPTPAYRNHSADAQLELPEGSSRTVGGVKNPNIPSYISTVWTGKFDELGPKSPDGRFIGAAIRLDEKHFLIPDGTAHLALNSVGSTVNVNSPAKINVDDGLPYSIGSNLGRLASNIGNTGYGLYRREKRVKFPSKLPDFTPPVFETNQTNLGTDCVLSGYSRPELKLESERHWSDLAVGQPVLTDWCLRRGRCQLPIRGTGKHCVSLGDSGLPIICGPSNDRKITYLSDSSREHLDLDCSDSVWAKHVTQLEPQLSYSLESSNFDDQDRTPSPELTGSKIDYAPYRNYALNQFLGSILKLG